MRALLDLHLKGASLHGSGVALALAHAGVELPAMPVAPDHFALVGDFIEAGLRRGGPIFGQ